MSSSNNNSLADHSNETQWGKTNYHCPVCKKPLYFTDHAGIVVWCPHADCSSIGMNEGGHGKTVEKALAVLLAKNGFGKDYEIERDEVLVENPETGSFEAKPRPPGKRGRKAKELNDIVWPSGKFTMKDFCEKNETYPAQALKIFEKNSVKECGKAPHEGRGKAPTLYKKD